MQSQREILAGTELYIHRCMEDYTKDHRTNGKRKGRELNPINEKEEEKKKKKSSESHDSKGNKIKYGV